MSCGIYKIICTPTGKFYIGSSNNILARWSSHKSMLNRNVHDNPYLQRAWRKYGSSAFEFKIIEEVIQDNLFEREQFYFNALKPWGKQGFNIGKNAAGGGDNTRIFFTKEKKEHIRASLIGEKNPNFGRNWTVEQKRRASFKHVGKKMNFSKEVRIKMKEIRDRMWTKTKRNEWSVKFSGSKNPFYGARHTKDAKQQMSMVKKNLIAEMPVEKRLEKYKSKIVKIRDSYFTSISEAIRVTRLSYKTLMLRFQSEPQEYRIIEYGTLCGSDKKEVIEQIIFTKRPRLP